MTGRFRSVRFLTTSAAKRRRAAEIVEIPAREPTDALLVNPREMAEEIVADFRAKIDAFIRKANFY